MRRLLGRCRCIPDAVCERCDGPLPTFLELLGPRDTGPALLRALLGLVLVVTTLIAAQTALGFVFDPRSTTKFPLLR